MRTLSLCLVAATALSGCGYQWNLREQILTGCLQYKYYHDADGDGWGDPAMDPIMACDRDTDRVDAGYTARNGRDCDDANASITGRIGSVCPADLVAHESAPSSTTFVPKVAGNEYVIVTGESDRVWGGQAAAACGDSGWGGSLVTFDDATELSTVLDGVSGAFWIDADGSSGDWAWNGMSLSSIGWCGSGSEITPSEFPEPHHARLAIVKIGASAPCLGTPAAGGGTYTVTEANFICERAIPDATAFEDDSCVQGNTGEGTAVGSDCP